MVCDVRECVMNDRELSQLGGGLIAAEGLISKLDGKHWI